MEKKASIQATLHSDRRWKSIYEQDQEYLNNFKPKNYCSYKGKSYVLLPKHIMMSDYFSKNLENADNQTLQLKMEDELNPDAFDATMKLIYGAADVTLENNWLLDAYSILESLSIPSSKIDPTFMKEFVEDILRVLGPEDYLRFYDRANHYEDTATQDKLAEMIRSTKLTETLTKDSIERISLSSIETWLKYHTQQKQLAISEKRSTSDFLNGDKIYELITFALRSLETQNPEIKKDWVSKFVAIGPEEPISLNNLLLAQLDVNEDERKTTELLKTNVVAINYKIDLERERTNHHLKDVQNSIIDHQTKQFEQQNAKIEQLEKLVMKLVAHSDKEETVQSKFVVDQVSSIIENKTSEFIAKLEDKTITILQKIEHKLEEQSSKFEQKLNKLQEKLDERFANVAERIGKVKLEELSSKFEQRLNELNELQKKLDEKFTNLTERIGKFKLEDQLSKFELRLNELQEKLDKKFENVAEKIQKVDLDVSTIQSAISRQEKLCFQSLENIKLIQENENLLKKQYESSLEAVRSSLHTDIESTWRSSMLMLLVTSKDKPTSVLHSIRKFEDLSKYSEQNLLKNILPFSSFINDLYPNKIMQNIKLEALKLLGFKIVFEADWNCKHEYEKIGNLYKKYSETAALVCMAGQKNKDSGLIDLCAISPIREAFKETSSRKEAYPVGDVYWFCVPDSCFGFAETKDVDLQLYTGNVTYYRLMKLEALKQSKRMMSWRFNDCNKVFVSECEQWIGNEHGDKLPYKKYLLILED